VVVARGAGLLCLWLVISRPDLPDFPGRRRNRRRRDLCLLPPGTGRLRPAALVRLGLRFVWQSAVAAADVARRALDPNLPLQPGFVLCPMRLAPGPARNAFLRPLEPSAGYAGGRVGPEGRAAHPLLPPVGIVIGVYLLWAGADEPGGAPSRAAPSWLRCGSSP
jgi:multicomponent Na+:H+ antiporter subunit E